MRAAGGLRPSNFGIPVVVHNQSPKAVVKSWIRALGVTLVDNAVGRRILLHQSMNFVPVFMLHRFNTPDNTSRGHDPGLVRSALRFLRNNGFHVLSVDDLLERWLVRAVPPRTVCFTIDDGYWDQGAVGAELFLESDCPVTIYLATSLTSGTFWPIESKVSYLLLKAKRDFSFRFQGDDYKVASNDPRAVAAVRRSLIYRLKDLPIDDAQSFLEHLATDLELDLPGPPPAEYRPLTWSEAAALEKRGVFFGAHSCRHATLSKEDDAMSWREIDDCSRALRCNLERPSRVFCYPTGRSQDYGAREIAYLKTLGYTAAVSAEPGYAHVEDKTDCAFHLRRFGFPSTMNEFKEIVLQLERVRERLRAVLH